MPNYQHRGMQSHSRHRHARWEKDEPSGWPLALLATFVITVVVIVTINSI